MVKLKIFLGIFCCPLDPRELVLGNKNFKIDDKTKPSKVNSCLMIMMIMINMMIKMILITMIIMEMMITIVMNIITSLMRIITVIMVYLC